MKLFQVIIVILALTILLLGFGIGVHKAYSSALSFNDYEDVKLVENGISKKLLSYMQSKDLAILLLLK